MAKPEWGVKRTCLSCGARFYDLMRSPILCPACGVEFDLEAAGRARRQRPSSRGTVEPDAAPVVDAGHTEEVAVELDELEAEPALEEAEEVVEETVEEDEDVVIEDAGDLGEDDAVGEVLDEEIEPDEDRR